MMSAPHADQLVSDYLGRLDSALAGLPKARREEILDEITNHIAEERSRLDDESDADLRNLLDRVGDPGEVAGAARDETVEPQLQRPSRRIGPFLRDEPDPEKSLSEGAIAPWSTASTSDYFRRLLEALANEMRFSMNTRWHKLPARARNALLNGYDTRYLKKNLRGRPRRPDEAAAQPIGAH